MNFPNTAPNALRIIDAPLQFAFGLRRRVGSVGGMFDVTPFSAIDPHEISATPAKVQHEDEIHETIARAPEGQLLQGVVW